MKSEDLLYNMAVAAMLKEAEGSAMQAYSNSPFFRPSGLPTPPAGPAATKPLEYAPWRQAAQQGARAAEEKAMQQAAQQYTSTSAATQQMARPAAQQGSRMGRLLQGAKNLAGAEVGAPLAAGAKSLAKGVGTGLGLGAGVGALGSFLGATGGDAPVQPGEKMKGWEHSTRAGKIDADGPGSAFGDTFRGAWEGATGGLLGDAWGR